jgi:hypothetical protein
MAENLGLGTNFCHRWSRSSQFSQDPIHILLVSIVGPKTHGLATSHRYFLHILLHDQPLI